MRHVQTYASFILKIYCKRLVAWLLLKVNLESNFYKPNCLLYFGGMYKGKSYKYNNCLLLRWA